jgi:hypothetical protein
MRVRSPTTTSVRDELYHASLPMEGEAHLAALGRLRWSAFPSESCFLVLTNQRVLVILAPGRGLKSYRPSASIPLETIHQMSIQTGLLSTVFSLNGLDFDVSHISGEISSTGVRGFRERLYAARSARIAELRSRPPPPPAPPGPPPPLIREREIHREIVKVPCRFCGQLVLITDPKCGSCGAPLR